MIVNLGRPIILSGLLKQLENKCNSRKVILDLMSLHVYSQSVPLLDTKTDFCTHRRDIEKRTDAVPNVHLMLRKSMRMNQKTL